MKAYQGSVVLRNDQFDALSGKDDLNAGVGKSVTVRIASSPPGQGALASIFDIDEVGIGNPLTTDSKANYVFKAADAEYDLVIEEGTEDE